MMRDPGVGISLVLEQDESWSRMYPSAIPASSEGLLAAVIWMDVETANIPDSQGRLDRGMCQFASLVMTGLGALEIRV